MVMRRVGDASRLISWVAALGLMLSSFAPPAAALVRATELRPASTSDSGALTDVEDTLARDDDQRTFVAATIPGPVTADDRMHLAKAARGPIWQAFETQHALATGPDAPALQDQTKSAADIKRVTAALAYLEAAAEAANLAPGFNQRRIAWIVSDNPALLNDGDLDLIGLTGNFPWREGMRGRDPHGSHYISVALVELANEVLGERASEFLQAWVAQHEAEQETQDWVEDAERTAILNAGYAQIKAHLYTKSLDAVQAARQRVLNQVTTDFAEVRLGALLNAARIPQEAVTAAEAVLNEAMGRGEIAGFWVLPAGDDLSLQVNHQQGENNPAVKRLLVEAATAALQAAHELRLTNDRGVALADASYADRVAGFGLRTGSIAGTERGAEQIIVAKAIDGGAGAFNLPLYKALASPDNHPAGRLGRETFTFVVQRIDDVRQGVKDRISYRFGPENLQDMMILLGDHSEWMVTEVYAATGRFAATNPDEPVVRVMVEPVSAEGFTDAPANPVLYIRTQSGSEAVGVFTNALARPWVGPAGANDAHHRVALPVSLEEANGPVGEGFFKVVAYSYAQYGKGKIPDRRDTIDLFNPQATAAIGRLAMMNQTAVQELQTVFQLAQEKAAEMARILREHGEMDPSLTARGAEALAGETAEALAEAWEPIPLTEKSVEEGGQVDDLVVRANEASKGRTLSDIKADAGGKVGHTVPPLHFSLDAEASLKLMQEDGLVNSYDHFSVGDDFHTATVHTRGADDHEIHLHSYETFWRMVWHATQLGFKWYGKGQDLVGEATRGRPEAELARIEQRFIDQLAQYLTATEMQDHETLLREGFRKWQASGGGDVVAAPFSGNITGQGPGFAEVPLPPEGATRLGILASDKTGPAAFNMPIVAVLLDDAVVENLNRTYGGAVAEIYDTKRHQRIFLDVETQRNQIRRLAANPDEYNFKRIWSKAQPGWDQADTRAYIGDRILLSASTEKLSVITGGEYRGKDDSVMVGVPELLAPIFLFMRDHVYFTQGDGFGSHYNFPVPQPMNRAVATVHSRAIQIGLWVDISADNQMQFMDVYAGGEYREARRRGEEVNLLFWDAQGTEVTPIGVGAARVEASYPLMKSLRQITSPDSKYAVPVHVDAGQAVAQGAVAGQFGAISQQTSAKVARAAHDVKDQKTVLLHLDFFEQFSDGAMAIQRFLSEIGFASLEEAAQSGAYRLVVHMPDAESDDAARERFAQIMDAVNQAGAADGAALNADWFTVTRDAPQDVRVAIGPQEWLPGVAGDGSIQVALAKPDPGQVASAAAAFTAGIEAAATADGRLDPTLAAKLDVQLDDLAILVEAKPLGEDVQADVLAYQQSLGSV